MRSLKILFFISAILSFNGISAREISLNGQWDLVLDSSNTGEREEWFLNENFPSRDIIGIEVPSSWEEYVKDYEGVAWYRRTFKVSEEYEGKVFRLHFGAVNYLAEVYLNDEPIGYHAGGYAPFEFRIDDLINYGTENILILRVISPIVVNVALEVDGMTRYEAPHWRGALMAGIWQDVKLLVEEKIFLQDAFVESRIDGDLTFHMDIQSTLYQNTDISISCEVKDKQNGQTVWSKSLGYNAEPGMNSLVCKAEIDNPRLWSPDHPALYSLEISINGEPAANRTFGMREFVSRPDGLYLNGKKFYMKAGFWEGLYPNKLAAPDSRAMVVKEIQLAKEAGMNTLRPWRKPPNPMVLDLADEMGMCMFGCPAIECMNEKPKVVPQLKERVFQEVSAMIRRDRNHPSIIAWELFNEIKRRPLARVKHETALLARSLDPTRAIIDESGGWANGARVYNPYSREAIPFNEIHSYLKSPVNQAIFDDYLHIGYDGYEEDYRLTGRSLIIPGAVTIVSEIGYGGFPDLESVMTHFEEKGNELTPTHYSHKQLYSTLDEIMEPSGLQEIFGSVKELCLSSQKVQADGNKLQIEAVRINPNIHGYCVHAFTGGDWVMGAGVLDIWRTPKLFFHTLTEVNEPLYFSARVEPANMWAGQTATLKVNAVNEYGSRKGAVGILLKTQDGNTFYEETIEHEAMQGVTNVIDKSVILPENIEGECVMEVRFTENGKVSSTNSYKFNVFPYRVVRTRSSIVALDDKNKIKPFLLSHDIPFSEELPPDSHILILTSTNDLQNDTEVALFRKVFEKVRAGATVCFFDPPAYRGYYEDWTRRFLVPETTGNKFFTEDVFPFKLISKRARGRWDPVNRVAADHPYFKGLPTREFMGQVYQNVAAEKALIGLDAKPIVSVVSWDIRKDYWGILGAWWGADLAIIPHGNGKIVLSTLQVLDYLGKDPVADIILSNIISDN